jgi:hypothetical protein
LEKLVGKKSKLTNSRKKSIADVIMELKEEGFFTQRRSISEIAEKIKAKGRNVKLTSLPAYLLKLVQNNQLKRERLNEGKKRVWSILPNHSNEVDYLQDIKKILADKIPQVLVDDILTSYEKILKEFVSLNYEGTLKEGGIFVEHIRRVLVYLKEHKIENEAPWHFENYMKDLRNDNNLPESLRILIPRMTLPVYDLRSKRRDVVHVKENVASYMDAYFVLLLVVGL